MSFAVDEHPVGALGSCGAYPVGTDYLVTAVDLVPSDGARKVKFGIWLREDYELRHLQYSCHYEPLTLRCSGYSAGSPCSPVPTAPRTPRS
jgi:hypothetical protein